MRITAFGLALVVSVAGCSSPTQPPPQQARYSLPPRHASLPPIPQAPSALADPGEAVWHLRAGLNVAALSCKGRGRTPVSGLYSRFLGRHKALLSGAYAAEQRRYGKALDRHQTQLYNRFANQRSPAQFCAASASVAKRAAAMDSPALAANARRLLNEIA
jgi:hypothetical protein